MESKKIKRLNKNISSRNRDNIHTNNLKKILKVLESLSPFRGIVLLYGTNVDFSITGLLRIMNCFGSLSRVFLPSGSEFEDKCVFFVLSGMQPMAVILSMGCNVTNAMFIYIAGMWRKY